MLPQAPEAPPVFAAEQAWQLPPHAVLQHTPSTQLPELHSLPAVHMEPLVFRGLHATPLQ
jgi:hypothetical protein